MVPEAGGRATQHPTRWAARRCCSRPTRRPDPFGPSTAALWPNPANRIAVQWQRLLWGSFILSQNCVILLTQYTPVTAQRLQLHYSCGVHPRTTFLIVATSQAATAVRARSCCCSSFCATTSSWVRLRPLLIRFCSSCAHRGAAGVWVQRWNMHTCMHVHAHAHVHAHVHVHVHVHETHDRLGVVAGRRASLAGLPCIAPRRPGAVVPSR